MESYTRFKSVAADIYKGGLQGKSTISTAADLTLTAAQRQQAAIGITATAASKTVTLGLEEGQIAVVINEGGTNAFTLKNVSGDTGTSIAAGKVCLVIGSKTANGTGAYVLN